MPYPTMICDNCSERVSLKFDIKNKKIRGLDKLKNLICPQCGKNVYDKELREELTNEKIWGDTNLSNNQA